MTGTGLATRRAAAIAASMGGTLLIAAWPVRAQSVAQMRPWLQTQPQVRTYHRIAESGQIDGGASGESLSSKLDRTGGVIAPKEDVDPSIRVPAPEPHPNSTPVIPPSQNGGGTAK